LQTFFIFFFSLFSDYRPFGYWAIALLALIFVYWVFSELKKKKQYVTPPPPPSGGDEQMNMTMIFK
jgi:hypothetical protein